MWCRLAAAVLIRPLAWEFPYAAGAALKRHPPKKKINWKANPREAAIKPKEEKKKEGRKEERGRMKGKKEKEKKKTKTKKKAQAAKSFPWKQGTISPVPSPKMKM